MFLTIVSETKKGSPEKHLIGTTLEDTKDIIQKVLEMKPDGIPVSDFPEVFQVRRGWMGGSHFIIQSSSEILVISIDNFWGILSFLSHLL